MKNNYEFVYENSELNYVQKQIKKYKTKYCKIKKYYDDKINKIDKYFDMINLMEEYRLEILTLLNNIIKNYPYFNNNAVIYLTGSFARNTVRIFSDLDLNIVYIEGTGENYQKYEELFYYMISETFSYPRRAVHSIITAFNNKENIKIVQEKMDAENINITLKDKNLIITYKIPYLSKKRFYLQYLNDKNYKTIFNNLKLIYDEEGIKEWTNNFLFLTKNKLVEKCYNEYNSYVLNNANKTNIKGYYTQLLKTIDNPISELSYLKNIKLTFQMDEMHFIYNSITLLQLINFIENKGEFSNSFKELLNSKNKKIKKVIEYFYKYNYSLIFLNQLFVNYNLEYSIHTNTKIDLEQYPLLQKEIDKITKLRKNINKKIVNILEKEVNI